MGEFKRVLAIHNIFCETLGTLEELFLADSFEIEKKNAQDLESVNSNNYSAIVILGGPMAVYDNDPYLQREQELIRDAMRNDLPVLGICLGSQLIAQATGGRVFRAPRKEIGWFDVTLSNEGQMGMFSGLKNPMKVFQWHGDTYELPKDAVVLAHNGLYPQAFQIGKSFGIQFHIEVNRSMIESWIQEYRIELAAENIDKKSLCAQAGEIEKLARQCQLVYRNFVRIVR